MLQEMIDKGSQEDPNPSMKQESFLDCVDKRKYWDLTSELGRKAKLSTETGLRKLLVKYREWQLERTCDMELQVNLDDATSLKQIQRLKLDLEDLNFKYEEQTALLCRAYDKEDRLQAEVKDLSYRLTQAAKALASTKEDLKATQEALTASQA